MGPCAVRVSGGKGMMDVGMGSPTRCPRPTELGLEALLPAGILPPHAFSLSHPGVGQNGLASCSWITGSLVVL